MHSRRLLFASALVLSVVCVAPAAAKFPVGGDADLAGPAQLTQRAPEQWLAYGFDDQLTNDVFEPEITPKSAERLHAVWQLRLDGAIVASPLARDGVVFVATEAGSVYALRADNGAILWHSALGALDVPDCGPWGISSTGAVDVVRGVVYVANSDGLVHALDLVTGAETRGFPVRVSTRPQYEYVWGGLRLVGDRLYVPIASYCDEPDPDGNFADGRLVALNVASRALVSVFDVVPGPFNLGGPWGFGGVSVERDGSALWTAVGNSRVVDPTCNCLVDNAGYANSLVRLTVGLEVLDSDRPPEIPNVGDDDFGAAPVLFDVPGCGGFAAANNKNGYLYIWRRNDVRAGPWFQLGIGSTDGPFIAQPSWSGRLRVLYEASARVDGGDGVLALQFDRECQVRYLWQHATGVGTQPPPLVLGEVILASGGNSGGWSALDAWTGQKLWGVETDSPTFAPPIAVGNRVFAGTMSGDLYSFGVSSAG